MSKTVFQEFKDNLLEILDKMGITENHIPIETNKNEANGQFSTTVALVYAKKLGLKPIDLANKIKIELMKNPEIKNVEIAGPGFINVELTSNSISKVIHQVIEQKEKYGEGAKKDYFFVVEEVSANPTGFLHFAHGRNAIVGDSLTRILKFNGYKVQTEYYINDAGNQINLLGLTVFINYLNLLGKEIALPEKAYKGGGYGIVAQQIIDQVGKEYFEVEYDDNKILDENVNHFFRKTAIDYFLKEIKAQLKLLDVEIDEYISEAELYAKIPEILAKYEEVGATYKHDGALFLNTTKFGDDKDRVLVKSNGEYTYLVPDLVNHQLRIERTHANKLVNIWGGDHHGYIARMRAGLQWLGNSSDILEIQMIQMVRLLKDGKEFKMSKRKGTAVWLLDVIELVGTDALRYMLASKAASSHMDLDLDLIKQKNASNPVYYAQYATARLNSILNIAKKQHLVANYQSTDLLVEKKELEILIYLDCFKEVINSAAKNRVPHQITDYIQKLATYFHSYYAEFKIIDPNNLELSQARLGLIEAILQVLTNAFRLIGVKVLEEM